MHFALFKKHASKVGVSKVRVHFLLPTLSLTPYDGDGVRGSCGVRAMTWPLVLLRAVSLSSPKPLLSEVSGVLAHVTAGGAAAAPLAPEAPALAAVRLAGVAAGACHDRPGPQARRAHQVRERER